MEKGHGPTQPIKYFGGEEREMSSGNLVTVAIGNQTCSADNVKESLAFMLLKNILGNGPNIKRGSLSGKLGKAVAKIEGQKAVGSFNFTYQDTGLAGALLTCEAAIAGNVSTYRNSQKHESTLLHTYVLNEFLTAYRSRKTKYF